MAGILFATNRQQLPATGAGLPAFGDDALPPNPNNLLCATATVQGIDITKPSSGNIAAMTPISQGAFAAGDIDPLITSKNDILVFVHGAANSFSDAITRAAYNQAWLAAAGLPSASSNFDLICFTWPARSYAFWNIVGDFVDYRHDQDEAQKSAYHFGIFLDQLHALGQRIGNRRLNLLCHSMGNYMLGGAVEQWFSNKATPPPPLFDEIVLAAADEIASSFSTPNGGRLSNLWRLGREITVYYNNDDVLMHVSHIANQNFRLGYDGPPNKADKHFFSPNVYEFVDCTGVNDFISPLSDAPDRSHQYYRQSPKVRADIAAGLAGLMPVRPKYDPIANVYSLFP
ncbi:MAG TPA: alpha/beta hydrolase [Alphaproteobacteria bacterium]|nr:alpha/beta hydrolase [Alphaproteobacteria bacterium]